MFKKFIFVIFLNFVFITNIQAQDLNKEQIYNKLTYIFNYDMLGVTIPFFESKVGIVKRINYDGREYEIGPCTIKVIGNESVESIKLEGISEICNFNASNIMPNNYNIDVYDSTFSDIIDPNYQFDVQFDCLFFCGTVGSGDVIFLTNPWSPFEQKFITVFAPVDSENQFILNKFDELRNLIRPNEKNEDRLVDNTFNDNHEYSGLIYETLKNIPIYSIAISYDDRFIARRLEF